MRRGDEMESEQTSLENDRWGELRDKMRWRVVKRLCRGRDRVNKERNG